MGNSEEWILDLGEWDSNPGFLEIGESGIRTQNFGFGGSGNRTQDYLKFSFGAVVIPLCYREIDDK